MAQHSTCNRYQSRYAMQSTMRMIVATVLLASALASAYHSSAKLRRDGMMNLYPFPRVGRYSENTLQLSYNRSSMCSQPRTGRSALSDSHEYQPMGVRRTETSGLLIVPRLGRGYKTEDDGGTRAHGAKEEADSQLIPDSPHNPDMTR